MQIHGEAIYATRPWTIYGEGPSTKFVTKTDPTKFDPNEDKKPDLGVQDIRFTTKGKTLYAFVMGWPTGPQPQIVIQSLATNGPQQPPKAVDVRLLGTDEPLKFVHDTTGLRVTLPPNKPATADIGFALRIRFV
jgi:alpha-L-fucosidase